MVGQVVHCTKTASLGERASRRQIFLKFTQKCPIPLSGGPDPAGSLPAPDLCLHPFSLFCTYLPPIDHFFLSVSLDLCLSTVSFRVYLSPSLSLPLSMSLAVSLSLSLSIFLYLSLVSTLRKDTLSCRSSEHNLWGVSKSCWDCPFCNRG